jgi:transcription initiation factor TFIIIB Brf1 subunit/transcription initiation factor TFIIB
MDAMRCKECGDVRWSFTGLADRSEVRCELCGAVMVPERRQPHRGPDALDDERRGMATAGPAEPSGQRPVAP